MGAIRSVLWIGSAEGLAASGLPETPAYDVVFERDAVHPVRTEGLDAIVIESPDAAAARRALARLGDAAERVPVLLRGADPHDDTVLEALDERLAPRRPTRSTPPRAGSPGLVAESTAMQRVLDRIARAAHCDATVLVHGETGTGKELVARAIHEGSARRDARFVAVNCAAFPDTLLESELLGHARGAFSGADRDRKGLVEEAHRGTLFLDEVAETSPAFQAKLLRVLQERRVRPLGANRERPVDLRVVAATHRDLARAVRRGGFREDLYYRLAVLTIDVPPLRARTGDLPALVAHLLARHGGRTARTRRLAPEVWPLLESHPWPGNVRELENEIQHALALSEPGEMLRRTHFSERLGRAGLPPEIPEDALEPDPDEALRVTLARLEAHLIRRALARHGGRRAETARRLGLTREGLYKKMKRLGIE